MHPRLTLLLLLVCAAAGCSRTPVWPDRHGGHPALQELTGVLSALLEGGGVAELDAPSANRLASRDYGVVADFRTWKRETRAYHQRLARAYRYRELPLVERLKTEPTAAALIADRFASELKDRCTAGHGLAGLQFLLTQQTGARPPESPPPPPATLHAFLAALGAAAAVVEDQALGLVTSEQRALLRFVVPWLCRSAGPFHPRSKGAPGYSMTWYYWPADRFAPGATHTGLTEQPIPLPLYSMTGIYHLLRSLSGEPMVLQGVGQAEAEAGPHPTWVGAVRPRGYAAALAELAPVLNRTYLRDLHTRLLALSPPPPPEPLDGVTGTVLAIHETSAGRVVIGGPGPNRYESAAFAVILDLGGDDEYVYPRGATRLCRHALELIIDWAGNDRYTVEGVGGPAAGILNLSLLIDLTGNDVYAQGLSPHLSPERCTPAALVVADPEGTDTRWIPYTVLYGNPAEPKRDGVPLDAGFAYGAGFFGVGALLDWAGDDLYLGQKHVFGAAMWRGTGLLFDASGDDVYAAGTAACGAGINAGVAALVDGGGRDHYQCLGHHESGYSAGRDWDNGYSGQGIGFGSSWRGEVRGGTKQYATYAGGLGLALDAAGDDMYVGSSFGVAAGYAGGAGLLADYGGDDTYFVKRGPDGANRSSWSGNHALANGCHRGVGILLEHAGQDRYSASMLGGGSGWDFGIGYLVDLGGDDHFTDLHGKKCRGNSGWAAACSLAVSAHLGGRDRYDRKGLGDASTLPKGYPDYGGNFGFFFDIGPEEDAYPKRYGNNSAVGDQAQTESKPDGERYPRGMGLFWDGPTWPTPPPR